MTRTHAQRIAFARSLLRGEVSHPQMAELLGIFRELEMVNNPLCGMAQFVAELERMKEDCLNG